MRGDAHYSQPFLCTRARVTWSQFTAGRRARAPEHGQPSCLLAGPVRRTPTIPRAETRWSTAAAAGEQCLGSEHSRRIRRRTRKYGRSRPRRGLDMRWIVPACSS
ncbi:hypothetical protein GN956_G2567 [Arapaima gigas]